MLEGSINNFFLNLLFISFRFREEILIIFFNVYIKLGFFLQKKFKFFFRSGNFPVPKT